ncbi:MAG: tetratricopeptide repeat protein [Terricaulis sp.]
MIRRTPCAIGLAMMLAACEPSTDAQRLAMHWQACQAGLPDARLAACTLVVEARDVSPEQRVEALIDRGMLRAERNEQERALADFSQALSLDGRSAQAYIQRGLLHEKRGAYSQAVVDFVAADNIDAGSGAMAFFDRTMSAQTSSYRTQISRLDGAIASSPNNAALYNDRCWLRTIIAEDLPSALADCNRALQLAPNSAEMLDSRGLANLKLGNYQAALADYDAALSRDPERGHYRYGRGLAHFALGQLGEAQQDWRAAEVTEPGIGAVYRSYGIKLPANVVDMTPSLRLQSP